MQIMHANLWKIIFLHTSWAMIVLQAVMAPFFMAKGLSLQEIFLVQALFGIALSLCEVPTGVLADLLGRRRTLIFAAFCRGLGGTGFVVLDGFWGMVACYFLIALGNSLLSGTDMAALTESHRRMAGAKRSLKSYLGTAFFLSFSAATLTALIGSHVAERSLELAAVVNMIVAWLALPVALTIRETLEPAADAALDRRVLHRALAILRDIETHFRQSRRLRLTLIAMACYGFAPAIALYSYQAFWLELHFRLEYFGYIFAAQSITTAFCARLVEPFYNRFGYQIALSTLGGLICCAFLMAGSTIPGLAIGSALLIGIASSLSSVIFVDELNGQIPDELRSTVNSLASLITRLLVFVVGPGVGYVAQTYGFGIMFFALGLVFIGFFLFIMLPLVFLGPAHKGEAFPDFA